MNLKVNDQLPVSIAAEDEFGNPTGAFDSPPAWSMSDPTMGTVAPAADGMSAVVTPSGKLGSANLQVLGQAGGAQIQGSLPLVMIAGDAAQIVLTPGTPVAAPPPAPAPAPAPAPSGS